MIRHEGQEGEIIAITFPIQAKSDWRIVTNEIHLNVLVEKAEDGKVVLVISDPALRELS